jgi:hypothetical protein
LNKPETETIVRNKGKSQTSHEEKMAIIASDAHWRDSLLPRRRPAPVVVARHGSWGYAGDWEKKA